MELKDDKEYGAIKLDASEYSEPIVVEMLSAGKMIQRFTMYETKNSLIEHLLPNEYTFRVIIDANKNGKWDSGDYEKGILPENIYTFSEITKVRANWEIDLKLTNKNK